MEANLKPGALPFPKPATPAAVPTLEECLAALGCRADRPETLPFAAGDVTAGTENELQVAVVGRAEAVDLPRRILESRYFANVVRRARAGETPKRAVHRLEAFVADNESGVWENSWVRFSPRVLSAEAAELLHADLRADAPSGPPRSSRHRADVERFLVREGGEERLRLPISYLLRLALADAVARAEGLSLPLRCTAGELRAHFFNDNSSPETSSFHVVSLGGAEPGREVARECARRFLLANLLAAYANRAFGLEESGQRAAIFFSPLPPSRQRALNEHISDAFYRELFISPCLSWERGEAKKEYMVLCHQVLSRSHLSAVAKLREAGILTNNLVVLPHTSVTSLANNGTHVSLGSRRLGAALADPSSPFEARHEKLLGDLVIKLVEHFLPLFVGTYTAAPYRLPFEDLHPEKALGFLPHELDFDHLRMVWRRWAKKAVRPIWAQPLRPLGPPWLDRPLARLCGLRGQLVPDFRLIDYPVALLSTDAGPALDGRLGNGERLKRDLEDLGVFDARMSLYLPYKLRAFGEVGFSGFEGRHYSLFESFGGDLARAVELQALVTALAFRYVAEGRWSHRQIPDEPVVESERRQTFFAAALDLPTLYVREDTPNRFLASIVREARGVRSSRRYKGYLRVRTRDYLAALYARLEKDGRAVAAELGLEAVLDDLRERLEHPRERSAAGRLSAGILHQAGERSPFDLHAEDFNLAAEGFYRGPLRRRQLEEALGFLEEDLGRLERAGRPEVDRALGAAFAGTDPRTFLALVHRDLLDDRLSAEAARQLIVLLVACEHTDRPRAAPLREVV